MSTGVLSDVGAFLDGSELVSWGQFSDSSDEVVAMRQIKGGVVISAFVDDVFDTRVAGVWIDEDAIGSCEIARKCGGYVVGTDHRSSLLGGAATQSLGEFVESSKCSLEGKMTLRYTRFGACARIGRLLPLKKVRNYPTLGSGSRMGVPRTIRTIALSPFRLPLSGRDNCIFELFRDCNSLEGRSLGKIDKIDLVDSGLLLKRSALMITAIGWRGIVVDGNHVRYAGQGETPSNICDVEGPFGLSDIDTVLKAMAKGARGLP